MNKNRELSVYQAQTKNVRVLKSQYGQIRRVIHEDLRKNRVEQARIHTLTLILVFSALVEAEFSKVLHTPSGYSSSEISQITNVYQNNGLQAGWKKAIGLGLNRVQNPRRSSYLQNIRKKLESIVKEFVFDPSLLRNKIAHGQWVVALNRENTSVNEDITKKLQEISIVDIDRWHMVLQKLVKILEELIMSPNRAFQRDYWVLVEKLGTELNRAESWTLQSRITLLQTKSSRMLSES